MATSVPMVDYSSSQMMAKQKADLYMRIYQYAAEDFRTVADCGTAHQSQAVYNQSIETRVINLTTQISTHTHLVPQSPVGILPSNPPTIPMNWQPGQFPMLPLSTTLRNENLTGNNVIPSIELSYVDNSATGTNISYTSFRRALVIPITTIITPPLTKSE
jgi:hypothetical protein